jgi:tetratricopeptide (TPR) repeat protein
VTTKMDSDAQLKHYLAGKIELASILEMTPQQMEQLRGRAQFFVDGEHDERAIIMLEMLEELDRTDIRPTLVAIDVLLRMGQSDAAKAKVDMLFARDAKSLDALTARAKVELAMGDWGKAAATLKELAAKDPNAKTDAGKRGRAIAAKAHATFEASR